MNMNQNPFSPAQRYQRNLKAASSNLLVFAILSAVNMVLVLTGSSITFTFSAYLPEMLVVLGQEIKLMTGKGGALAVFIVISLLFIVACVVSALLAKKRPLLLILGLVLVAGDTVLMLIDILPVISLWIEAGMTVSLLIYFLFHAWILYYLINGLVSYSKLKALPPEPMTYDVPFETVNPSDQNGPSLGQ